MNSDIRNVTLQFFSKLEIEDLQSIIEFRVYNLKKLFKQYPDNVDFIAGIQDEIGRMEEHHRRLEEAKK